MTKPPQKGGAGTFPHLGKIWTPSNVLSMLRGVLAIPITYLILVDGPLTWLFGLLALAVLTDWFDGNLARWSHTVSEWGKVLDPVADKIAAASVTMALVIREYLPAWFLGIVLARDIVVVLGGILLARRTGQVVMSIWWGKVAVTALSVTIILALLRADPPVIEAFIWITTVLLLYAFFRYMIRFFNLWRNGPVTSSNLSGDQDTTVVQSNR